MANKRGLGRGLDALLGGTNAEDIVSNAPGPSQEEGERVRELSILDIDPNRSQPRRSFDKQALEELAESIKSVGIISPIVVRPEAGRYTIIAGERRWRAARLAGLSTVPAIVREYDQVRTMEVALIENLQRDDLNPVEEAAAVSELVRQCGLTQEAVAARIGRSRPAVANLLRLLTLPEAILDMLRQNQLSAGHARALVAMPVSDGEKIALAQKAVEQGYTVRQMEQAAQPKPPARPRPDRAVELDEMEALARDALGVKASLSGGLKRGRITLYYHTQEDLDRIWEGLSRLVNP